MNHSNIQSRMASYLDGELSLEARALFDAHLDQCDACTQQLADMRDTIRLLRRLPSPEPPPDLVSDVMRRIAQGEGDPSWFVRVIDELSRFFTPRFVIPATAAAAALTLTVLSGDLGSGVLDPRTGQSRSGSAQTGLDVLRGEHARVAVPIPGRVASVGSVDERAQPALTPTVRIASPTPPLRYQRKTGTGSFLYRVANDQPGPLRRQPREADVASRILLMSDSPRVGPYLGVSAAPSIALGVGASGLSVAGLRPKSGSRIARGGLVPVVVPHSNPASSDARVVLSPEERRHRELDARLSFLKEDPPGFAHSQAQISLAERELWLRELAARAEEIGEVERVLHALEGSGDEEALSLARDFGLAVKHNRASWAAAEAPPILP